jgi:hypothetical protein
VSFVAHVQDTGVRLTAGPSRVARKAHDLGTRMEHGNHWRPEKAAEYPTPADIEAAYHGEHPLPVPAPRARRMPREPVE